MTTEYFDLKGKIYWAKVSTNKPDEYAGDRRWIINLVVDDWDEFEETGLQVTRREGPDGDFIQLRRSCKKLINDEVINFLAPVIIDENGKWIRYYTDSTGRNVFSWVKNRDVEPTLVGRNMLITNGSDVSVRVAVYDTMKGKGHRMESIQINDMAPSTLMSENQELEKESEESVAEEKPKKAKAKPEAKDDSKLPPGW